MSNITDITSARTENEDPLKAHNILLNYTLSFIKSMSLKSAIELGIPDAIHCLGMPATISDLLSTLSIPEAKSRCLGVMMRLLTSGGIFKSHNTISGEEAFDLTPISRLLVTTSVPHHPSISPFILTIIDHHFVDPYQQLSHWLHRPDNATTVFEMAYGKVLWDVAEECPEFNNVFNKGVASDSAFVMDILKHNGEEIFRGIRTLVDVGGGTGLMAAALVDAFPGLKCIVLDLPHVIETVEKTDKIQFIEGDMFVEVPPADAILLKLILHAWNDNDCIKILQRCKEALPPKEKGGKIIIIDIVVGNKVDAQTSLEAQRMVDMHMMVHTRGKERNQNEWHKLFVDAGFNDYKITTSLGLRSIIEVYP